jgi:uncharacterized protein YbjT (DUF2867 family)
VRDPAAAQDLAETGAELAVGDLTRPGSLEAALDGVRAIVATANVVAPIRAGDTAAALDAGYAELITRAERAGVSRFVLASVPETPLEESVPVAASKRRTERRLAASALSWTSVRMPPFTEIWLALVGSELPLRGEQRATLSRPYATLRRFRRLTGRTVDTRGVMVVPGPASARQSFLSVHDAARGLAAAADDPELSGAVDLAGPEILSWSDVAEVYARVLGRPVRVRSVPARAYAVPQRLFARIAPSLAGTMGLNRLIATSESAWTTPELVERLGIGPLRTVEQVLREKAALPAGT